VDLRLFRAFTSRDFRLLWAGQAISAVGDAAFFTALGWRAFTLVGSSRLGIVFLFQGVGLLATLLIGGALADRLPRRTMMITSDLARCVVVGAFAVIDATGHLSFPLLVGLALLAGLGDGFFFPAIGGIVPLVVEAEALPSANSLFGVTRWGSILLGPSVAALLYHALGSSVVFGLDAASFVVSAVLLWLTRPRAVERETKEGAFQDIVDGVRYVARVPWLWVTIVVFALILMLQLAPQQVLMPALVKEHFHRGVGAYGLITTLVGAGSVLGTLAYGQWPARRNRGRVDYGFFFVNSLGIAGIGLSPWFAGAVVSAGIRGFCLGYAIALWETMLQELVPEEMLSRVVSLDVFGSFGLMPVGLAVWAGLAGIAAPGTLIGIGALCSAAIVGITMTRPWLEDVK
jgi:MFS family permease